MAFGIEKCGRILLETSFSYSMFENDEEERLIISFLIVQSVKYNQKVIIIFAWFPDTSKRCDEGLLCLWVWWHNFTSLTEELTFTESNCGLGRWGYSYFLNFLFYKLISNVTLIQTVCVYVCVSSVICKSVAKSLNTQMVELVNHVGLRRSMRWRRKIYELLLSVPGAGKNS